jgi:acetyl esterase/lipase
MTKELCTMSHVLIRSISRMNRRAALSGFGAMAALSLARFEWAAAQDGASIEATIDVPYGEVGQPGSDELVLDLYQPPAREAPRPALVVVHGGAWTIRSKEDWSENAQKLAEAGYVVFNLNYRLMKEDGRNPWPDQFDDVQRAVRWVRANAETYGIDPKRVGAVGHSSGGQMVGLLGTRETRDNRDSALATFSSRVDCVVNLAGDMDLMIPYPIASDNELAEQFFGGGRDEVPGVYRDASPITWVDKETVPFLILQGAAGDPAVEHSRLMTEALHEAGVEVVYGEYPDVGHIDLIDWQTMGPLTLAFLGQHLHPGSTTEGCA